MSANEDDNVRYVPPFSCFIVVEKDQRHCDRDCPYCDKWLNKCSVFKQELGKSEEQYVRSWAGAVGNKYVRCQKCIDWTKVQEK
jgi:hypothetical protein